MEADCLLLAPQLKNLQVCAAVISNFAKLIIFIKIYQFFENYDWIGWGAAQEARPEWPRLLGSVSCCYQILKITKQSKILNYGYLQSVSPLVQESSCTGMSHSCLVFMHYETLPEKVGDTGDLPLHAALRPCCRSAAVSSSTRQARA